MQRALARQVGARNYQLDIDTGLASCLPHAGVALDVSAVGEAVADAGFQLLWLELELRGTLHGARDGSDADGPTLVVDGTGQRFLLNRGKTEAEQQGFSQLAESLDSPGREIILRGRAHDHSAALPAITVREFTRP